ncbi:MAG TPA: hypothetical protein ENH84_01270 [Phycisphaerae bacterium]|nr:hypothetical protein [Phycisphaerae bacterium]
MPDVYRAVGEEMSIRKTGCCVDCDTELYEIRQTHTKGPYTGHPMRLGPPLDGGLAITFLLMDGTLCDLSLCAVCGPEVEAHLPRIWRKVMNSMVYEQVSLSTITGPATEGYRQLNLHLVSNPPLGVLYTRSLKEKWQDRLNG